MKFTSREEKLRDYNAKHPEHFDDATERVRRYFAENNLNLEKACLKARNKALQIIEQREYETIRIVLREYPSATPRPRVYNGHAFSPGAADNKRYFIKAWDSVTDAIKLISTPAEFLVDIYMEMPANVPPDEVILFEAKLLQPMTKPDFDNASKPYSDMLTEVVTCDDDIFWHADIHKWYSLEPRVDLRLTYLKANESDYIYKKLKSRKTIKEAIAEGRVELARLGEN